MPDCALAHGTDWESFDRVTSPPSIPLLSVKQITPPLRAGFVARDRLQRRLTTSATKLSLVVAPAGWGKTSVLAGFAHAVTPSTPIAWVSLDETDDEPMRFWSYVFASLRRINPDIDASVFKVLSVEASVRSRKSLGGTAPANVGREARAWAKRLKAKAKAKK